MPRHEKGPAALRRGPVPVPVETGETVIRVSEGTKQDGDQKNERRQKRQNIQAIGGAHVVTSSPIDPQILNQW
jgi:hypothetical protein